jgi:poly(hydroxyalkanoate) depolymerase family esterase
MVPWILVPPERAYRLYVPAGDADVARPLVVMIHGCRQNAAAFAAATRMNALADRFGFAVLYPDQLDAANIHRCWNWFESQTLLGKGEASIVMSMLDRAMQRTAIDAARVTVAGLSSGGALAALLAFHFPDRFRDVMVHSGLPPLAADTLAQALHVMRDGADLRIGRLVENYWRRHRHPPPRLMVTHGEADDRVNIKNADATLQLWSAMHQAHLNENVTQTSFDVPAVDHAATPRRGYRMTKLLHRGAVIAESVRVNGLAHVWSGGAAQEPYTDASGPDASKMLVEFAGLDRFWSEAEPQTSAAPAFAT